MGVRPLPSGVVRVLAIQNDAIDPVQWVGEWLMECDCEVRVIKAFAGEPVPRSVPSDIRGLISLGGAMNANADDIAPWLPDERALLADAVAREIPVLGLCLGGQLLAAATGGVVSRGDVPEVGVVSVHRTPAALQDPLMAALPNDEILAAQWHQDYITDLPGDATLLLTNDTCPVQGFRIGSCGYGLQMHPEVTSEYFATWREKADDVLTWYPGDADAAVADVAARTGLLQSTWRPVVHAWASLVKNDD
jgi:GMP synthase (glutamine-hydrolysing)